MKTRFFAFIFIVFIVASAFYAAPENNYRRMSVHMENKKLQDGKLLRVEGHVYYLFDQGRMLTHYTHPREYFFITNRQGEAKIYYPDKNEVYVQQDATLSSENDILMAFFENQITDMGLRDLGFTLRSTDFDDGLMVTTWNPPLQLNQMLSKVELVHENHLPIYSAYYKADGSVLQKLFYYEFRTFGRYSFPSRITSFEYMENGDSVVSRKVYSDFAFDDAASSGYFDFEIPDDAKVKQ